MIRAFVFDLDGTLVVCWFQFRLLINYDKSGKGP
jgi:FMN phosphatase YigB (HAD superfamily)